MTENEAIAQILLAEREVFEGKLLSGNLHELSNKVKMRVAQE
jgi:hypothetical protein